MNKQPMVFTNGSRQSAQVFDSFAAGSRIIAGFFELAAGPEDCLFGRDVEAFRIEQRTAVVIPQDAKVETHHGIEAGTRFWAVTDHIAQTDDTVDLLRFNVREDGFERGQVSVDVAKNGCTCHPINVLASVDRRGHRPGRVERKSFEPSSRSRIRRGGRSPSSRRYPR